MNAGSRTFRAFWSLTARTHRMSHGAQPPTISARRHPLARCHRACVRSVRHSNGFRSRRPTSPARSNALCPARVAPHLMMPVSEIRSKPPRSAARRSEPPERPCGCRRHLPVRPPAAPRPACASFMVRAPVRLRSAARPRCAAASLPLGVGPTAPRPSPPPSVRAPASRERQQATPATPSAEARGRGAHDAYAARGRCYFRKCKE